MHKQRDFLLFVIFAAVAATPGWGQTLVPAAGSTSSSAQGAPSIPDFSGIWGNPFLTGGLEAPTSGPGLREALGKRPVAEPREVFGSPLTDPESGPWAVTW